MFRVWKYISVQACKQRQTNGLPTLVEDAMAAAYLDRLAQTRALLDSRYDDLKSGRVTPVNGEAFFECLRLREEESLNKRTQ